MSVALHKATSLVLISHPHPVKSQYPSGGECCILEKECSRVFGACHRYTSGVDKSASPSQDLELGLHGVTSRLDPWPMCEG